MLNNQKCFQVLLPYQDHNDLYLRVAVEGGGCSGLSYKLGLDYSTENDIKYENYGVEIIVEDLFVVPIVLDLRHTHGVGTVNSKDNTGDW